MHVFCIQLQIGLLLQLQLVWSESIREDLDQHNCLIWLCGNSVAGWHMMLDMDNGTIEVATMLTRMMISLNSEMGLGTCSPHNQVLIAQIMYLMCWRHLLCICTDIFLRRMGMKYIRCMKTISRNWVRCCSSRATDLLWRWLPRMWTMTMSSACCTRKCGFAIWMHAYSPPCDSWDTITATSSRSFRMETWICSSETNGCGIWWMNSSTNSNPSASTRQNWSKEQTKSWPFWGSLTRYYY